MLVPFAFLGVFMVAITTPGLIALHLKDKREAGGETT